MKNILIVVIVAAVVATATGFWMRYRSSAIPNIGYPEPVGSMITTPNAVLQSNINTYMQLQGSPRDLGHDHYFCSNLLYGYDETYAYTQVYCMGYVVQADNELALGTGFDISTRLHYQKTDWSILDYVQPEDDGAEPSLRSLFPKSVYVQVEKNINDQVDTLAKETLYKAKASIASK